MRLERVGLLLLEDSGSDWWEEPRDLREKLLLDKFNAASMRPLPGEVMIRRGNHNWTKWEYIHKSRGGYTTTLHFWKTPQGERVEPKFKYVSLTKQFNPKSVTKEKSPIDYAIQKHDMPKNLREKLVYEIVMSGASKKNESPVKFKPTKKPFVDLYNRGWRKWLHVHRSLAGCVTAVHFWKSKKGERIFPKFSRVNQKAELKRICAWRSPYGLSLLESSGIGRADAISRWLAKEAKRLGVAQHIYIAGGAVRDFVMGKVPKDVDIVVDQTALGGRGSEWLANALSDAIPVRSKVNANKYGAALLSISEPWELDGHQMKGEVLDIADAAEGRDPDPMTSHLKGFDLTFNTLAWRLADLARGQDKAKILDLTGCGMADIKGGVMRCPSDPNEAFSHDPSRLLRIVKFLVRYRGKFKLPPDTIQAVKRAAPKIKNVEPNKLSSLLTGEILNEKHFDHSIAELKRLGLFDAIASTIGGSKGLRKTMENWARAQSVKFVIKIKDSGLPITSPIDFLTSKQQGLFRRAVRSMPAAKAQAYLDALKQPGKAIKDKKFMPTLARSIGANMREFAPSFTVSAREAMLDQPALSMNPEKLKTVLRTAFS